MSTTNSPIYLCIQHHLLHVLIFQSIHALNCLSLYSSTYPLTRHPLPTRTPSHLSIHLFIYLSINLLIHPSFPLSTHPPSTHYLSNFSYFIHLSFHLLSHPCTCFFFFQIAIYLPIHLPRPPLPTLIHLIATRMEGGWNRYEGPVLLALARVPRMCGPGTVEWGPDGSVEERWGLRRGSGQGRRNGKRRRGEDGHFSWGPEELVKRCVPQAGEGKGRVRTTPE